MNKRKQYSARSLLLRLSPDLRLLLVFAVFLIALLLLHFRFTSSVPLEASGRMEEAAFLAQDWFGIIAAEKEASGIRSDATYRGSNAMMIGDDFTLITTTLGSLEAKAISSNPDFAALMVRLLDEAGAGAGDRVGLIISGSFPALAVSTLAALQVMDLEPVLLSSLGASAYGANQPGATWIDMETWLVRKGGMKCRSALVSAGAENDRGEGLTREGMDLIREAARRNKRDLYMPEDLMASIGYKTRLLQREGIRILVNIGGNQAALGSCAHASSLPNGFHRKLNLCRHADRGIIREMNARGIPVIHLLHIRDLASEYGMDLAPGREFAHSAYLYQTKETRLFPLMIALCAGLLAMGLFLKDIRK
jgi:poly-gamma-glutamate system protein